MPREDEGMTGLAPTETHVELGGRTIRISSPEKVLFPEQGWTKLDVVEHFLMCAPGALRGVYHRPSLLKRWNRGVGEPALFVKRPKGAPRLVDVTFPSARPGQMFAPMDEGDVIWMAQMNCIDLNPWNARADDLVHPDELRIDLDPTEGYDFEAARDVAATISEILDDLHLTGWPKTSGNRGIHIYIRVEREWDFYEVRRAALALAREAERRNDLATTAWWKEEREGVFIDFNQNAWDKTIASAYSIRHTGLVSTPFRWDELATIDHRSMDLMTFKERWADVGDLTDGIDEAAGRLEGLLEMVAADEERGLGDAPWPPHYPKMPGEPPRVQPSKMRKENWE
ncbi:MAG: ATP-dependent DNA ligase [Acidimicrobiia bacterium]|nr:ATP-dependent DNA ligase [Acidimicrobiia bacterium]